MKEPWGWPFLPFNKLGESSKINGFIGSLMQTVKGMYQFKGWTTSDGTKVYDR